LALARFSEDCWRLPAAICKQQKPGFSPLSQLKRRVVGLTAIAGCPHEKFSAVRQALDQGDGV